MCVANLIVLLEFPHHLLPVSAFKARIPIEDIDYRLLGARRCQGGQRTVEVIIMLIATVTATIVYIWWVAESLPSPESAPPRARGTAQRGIVLIMI